MTANDSKIETAQAGATTQAVKPRTKAKRSAAKPRPRTGPQADWKHVGGEVPPDMFDKVVAAARKDAVPQAAILRWALSDYFASAEGGDQ